MTKEDIFMIMSISAFIFALVAFFVSIGVYYDLQNNATKSCLNINNKIYYVVGE